MNGISTATLIGVSAGTNVVPFLGVESHTMARERTRWIYVRPRRLLDNPLGLGRQIGISKRASVRLAKALP